MVSTVQQNRRKSNALHCFINYIAKKITKRWICCTPKFISVTWIFCTYYISNLRYVWVYMATDWRVNNFTYHNLISAARSLLVACCCSGAFEPAKHAVNISICMFPHANAFFLYLSPATPKYRSPIFCTCILCHRFFSRAVMPKYGEQPKKNQQW